MTIIFKTLQQKNNVYIWERETNKQKNKVKDIGSTQILLK